MNTLLRKLSVACVLLVPVVAASGQPVARADKGQLVIVGGGLEDENAAIYRAMIDAAPAGSMITIVPSASGEAQASAESKARAFSRYVSPERIRIVMLTPQNASQADDAQTAKQIADSGVVFFTGGDQARILEVFRPPVEGAGPMGEVRDTAAFKALQGVLERGGVIAGTSAGAAMMSDPMITGGRSDASLRRIFGGSGDPKPGKDSEDRSVGFGRGMGFFTLGLTDQHFLERERWGRLAAALCDEASGSTIGWGICENAALVVDIDSGRCQAVGDGAVLVLSRAAKTKTDADGVSSLRVDLLTHGDIAMSTPAGLRVERGERPAEIEPTADAGQGSPSAPTPASPVGTDADGRDDSFSKALEAMDDAPTQSREPVEIKFQGFVATLRFDDTTRISAAPVGCDYPTIQGLWLDIRRVP